MIPFNQFILKEAKKFSIILLLLFLTTNVVFSQGSWNPPGLDPVFPRTLLDSASIPAVRAALSIPEHLVIYGNIWLYANSTIPAGNTEILDRYYRSLIAKEAAFVFLMDRKVAANTVVPLLQVERDSMVNRTIRLLESINTDVDVGSFLTFYNPWQYRSKELIAYLIAYDLLRGAGISITQLAASKTRLVTFAANLYQKAMATYVFPLNLKFFTYQFNNHSIMTASALGLAAVVFNDYSSSNVNYQPQNWINAGFYNIDNTLWIENGTYPRVSEPDTLAGYAEGPHYLRYGFENAFPFIRAMFNFLPDGNYPVTFNSTTRNIRNPWYDVRYDRLYDWMNKIRMPDGSCPAIHDSYMGFGTVIMALSGKPQFNWPNPGFTPIDPMYRTQYLATNVVQGPIDDSLFQSLPAAGSLVFRSSWESPAVYMHFIGKHGIALTGAKSHHQGDASSFSLAAYNELMAVDPGYPGSSQAALENKATDHSLILVNGAGPLPPTGESVNVASNTAYIENCFDTPFIDYGEVRVTYQGADVVRKNMFIRNKYFLLSDFVSASTAKNFTFQLHGNGLYGSTAAAPTGAFVPDFANSGGKYVRNSVSLLARVTVSGNSPNYTYELDSLVIAGSFRRYSKMLVQANSLTNAVFLATLYPFQTVAPVVSPSVQNSSVTSVRIQADGFRDLAFCSRAGIAQTVPADSSGMNKQVTGNGKINFLSENSEGQFSSAFLQYGDSIRAGMQTIIVTNRKLDVAWMTIDSNLSSGYVSDYGVVKLHSGKPLQLLSGPIDAVSYDSVKQLAVVIFNGKGNFSLGSNVLTWVWTGAEDQNWHNPENWQMQDHPSVHGTPGATNSVMIPFVGPNMPVISSENPAMCHNLTIQSGAFLTVETMKYLTVSGTLTLESN